MAQLSIQHGPRETIHNVDPHKLICDESLNARRFPPSDEKILNLAHSIIKLGQESPIECRKDGNDYTIVYGFTRYKAIMMINSDPELRELAGLDGEHAIYPIRIMVVNANRETGIIRNITENNQRNETSIVDDAFNQDRLRKAPFHYEEKKIADLYGTTTARVSQLKGLLRLTSDELKLIHEEQITGSNAIKLARLPEIERAEVVQSATISNGTSQETVIDNRTLNESIDKAQGKVVPRKPRQFIVELGEIVENDAVGKRIQDITAAFMRYAGDKDYSMDNLLDCIVDAINPLHTEGMIARIRRN